MAIWLLKTEPSEYSFDTLLKDGQCLWDGIANNTAQMHLRAAKKGHTVIIYHTGDERRAVGLATIAAGPEPDTKSDNSKHVAIRLHKPKALKSPVTLEQIKADPAFAKWDLLRLGRLSVVPTPEPLFERLLALAIKQ